MRARRLFLSALLLSLAHASLAAQLAASAAVGAVAPVLPLSYQARILTGMPTLAAGEAYLADTRAQEWFRANRPELVPALTRRALELSDWKQVLTDYDDPRLLREALLSRPDSELAMSGQGLLALVDRTPELAERRGLIEVAALEWTVVSDETRAMLAKTAVDEELWAGMNLPQRYESLRRAYAGWIAKTITAAPGTEEYAKQYEKVLTRTRGVLTNEELADRRRELKQAQEVAAALTRAKAAVEAAGGDAEVLLDAARAAGSLDGVSRLLAPLHRTLGIEAPPLPRAAEPSLVLEPREKRWLTESFYKALLAELSGDPIGEEARAYLAAHPTRFRIGEAPYAALAFLDPMTGDITIGEKSFAQAAAALGYDPAEVALDPRALREVAIVFGHALVHETTHAMQHDWAGARLGGRRTHDVYSQQWEFEAYAAQAAFLRSKMDSDPAYAMVAERLIPAGGALAKLLLVHDEMAENPAGFHRGIIYAYRRVPTLARASSRLVSNGQKADARSARELRAIGIELGLRTLQARGVEPADAPVTEYSGMTTARLRIMRRELSTRGAAMAAFVAELLARSHAELERLSSQ
ncbi:MAG: hypothetical protein ACHQ2Z_12585 [Elusimicrobiota bacterium]